MSAADSHLMRSQSSAEPGRDLVEEIGSYLIGFQSQVYPVEEAFWYPAKENF